jgi:kynurenine formamidase
MPTVVDLTLPVRSGMSGIPRIPLYAHYPASVRAVTVVDEAQRALLHGEGVEVLPDAPAVGHMNTVLALTSHLGTHVDAPRHFFAEGLSVDQLALDRLVQRPAVVLDVSGTPAGAGVTGDALEACGVRPKPGEIIVIKTRWTDRAWGTEEFWSNTIWLSPSVSEWTAQFDITAVAMDCFPEKPFWRYELAPSERGANHRRWLGAGLPMLQLLTGLDAVGSRFTLTALPLRLAGMDGSPARVVGICQ